MLSMAELFNVHPPVVALRMLLQQLESVVASENVASSDALDRVLAQDTCATEDLPAFRRSTMDGFAVRARDTHGASESLPAYLEIVADVPMGNVPTVALQTGQCAGITTGGMLPADADAVIMVEQTQRVGASTIEALRSVAAGENVIQIGEDVRVGDPILPRGHTLRPQDIGALLAAGIMSVSVARRLRVAIVSGGDELVHPSAAPAIGQIRDINSYTLAALVRRAGHEPYLAGVLPDEFGALVTGARAAFDTADVLILSAGSSLSARDMTAQVIAELGPPGVLVHGVSLKPGKPTILAVCAGKPAFGLPGNPVSCMVTFDLFVSPTLAYLSGARDPRAKHTVSAVLARNVASVPGREDHIQVRLERRSDGVLEALPVFGKSNLIFTLVKAHGLVEVPLDRAGLAAGTKVDVVLF
jgi:molybdopterin molybdotransferase